MICGSRSSNWMNKIHLSRHFSKIQRLSEIRTKIIMRRIDSIKIVFFSRMQFLCILELRNLKFISFTWYHFYQTRKLKNGQVLNNRFGKSKIFAYSHVDCLKFSSELSVTWSISPYLDTTQVYEHQDSVGFLVSWSYLRQVGAPGNKRIMLVWCLWPARAGPCCQAIDEKLTQTQAS